MPQVVKTAPACRPWRIGDQISDNIWLARILIIICLFIILKDIIHHRLLGCQVLFIDNPLVGLP